jgi:hypothetical protein
MRFIQGLSGRDVGESGWVRRRTRDAFPSLRYDKIETLFLWKIKEDEWLLWQSQVNQVQRLRGARKSVSNGNGAKKYALPR